MCFPEEGNKDGSIDIKENWRKYFIVSLVSKQLGAKTDI